MTILITPNEACPAGSTFNLFSMSVGSPTPKSFTVFLNCDTQKLGWMGDLSTATSPEYSPYITPIGPVSIYLSFDLDIQAIRVDLLVSQAKYNKDYSLSSSGLSFDANSKFYMCADKDGASARACTVSKFIFEYRFYGMSDSLWAHQGDTDPAVAAFYPLLNGVLASPVGSASSAYFGDSPSSPTAGTSPTWGSLGTNTVVTISVGQFLTIPLPSLSSTNPLVSKSFSFAAWVKISSIPASATTIFSMHLADGTKFGHELIVSQSTKRVSIKFGSIAFGLSGTAPTIALGTWQLVGFTAYTSIDRTMTEGTIFVGASYYQFGRWGYTDVMDISSVSLIRVGGATNSISGQVSFVRIMVPGGGFLKTTDLCSSANSIELGVGSFALACSGTNVLNLADSKCYPSCSSDAAYPAPFPGTSASFCLAPCSIHCTSCNSTGCSTCETNYVLYQGNCLGSCPNKTYSDGTTCQNCSSTDCKTCDSAKCLSCETNYILYQGNCLSSCPDKTYSDGTTCQNCSSTDCKTCDSTKCLTCETNYVLYQGNCLSSCPDKTYSDGTTCQSCPISCTKCTSTTSCQACSPEFTLSNSQCVASILNPSPSLKTEAAATQTVTSAASTVGSVASVGTSVPPIVGLVSEAVQNTRYLNLSVTPELAQIYKTFSTDMISWDLPNFRSEVEDFKPLSELFARYELDASFLVNFWSTMMTMGLGFCVLILFLVLQRSFFKRGSLRGGLLYSWVQKMIAGSINFIIVQAYGSLDNVLFYFVLDMKTNPWNSAYSRASFALGIFFIISGILLMIFSIRIVQKYHVLKREGLAKNNMKNLEAHKKKNAYFDVFYGDFSDADIWSHCFLAFLVLRSNIASLVLTILYQLPLMQTIFLITLDGAILLFMIVQKPFTTLRGAFFQYYFEVIVLVVHICTFLLSWNDGSSEALKKGACTTIIYLNTALVAGGLGFMFIDIHEAIREKIAEWKQKKAEKNAAAVFPLSEESNISLQNKTTVIEVVEKTVNTDRSEGFFLQQEPQGNHHLHQIRGLRRKPRNRLPNRDMIHSDVRNHSKTPGDPQKSPV